MELVKHICDSGFRSFDGETLRMSKSEPVPFLVSDPARLTVEVGAGVSAQLVVLHSEPVTSKLQIVLGAGAQLDVAQVFTAETFAEVSVGQSRDSVCRMTVGQLTAANARYRIDLNGTGAESALYGFFLAAGDELCVTEIRTNHRVPDCRSESVLKGVAGGCARGEFRGLVYVAQDAQRTDARQQSRNVLLSETARILTEPQLEIYADDVKCSHGATVGLLDTEAIFYMRQRGLSEAQARRLQIEGFVGDVASHCGIDTLTEELMQAVVEKMEKM